MTFSIDNYSLDLTTDDYLIGHFNSLSPDDQQAILIFLRYMENLKNALPDKTIHEEDINDERIAYADDVVNTMVNNILATWKDNYQDQLQTIKHINDIFGQGDAYLYGFERLILQTPEEDIKNNDFEQMLRLGNKYINDRKQHHARALRWKQLNAQLNAQQKGI
mgnify:FL=1|jgi:hypothetical protein